LFSPLAAAMKRRRAMLDARSSDLSGSSVSYRDADNESPAF